MTPSGSHSSAVNQVSDEKSMRMSHLLRSGKSASLPKPRATVQSAGGEPIANARISSADLSLASNVIIGNNIVPPKRAFKASSPMDTHLAKSADPSITDLGRRVRAARQAQDLTLETASRLCGVSRSTLSKVENGLMSPTFDVLQKIVLGLKIEIGELFGSTPKVSASGRRALTRKNEGQRHAYRGYQMELLATDLAHKAMLPFRIRISAHTLDAFDDWGRHEGEEFLYVISGSVCLYSELYAPTHLNAGDSLYFDSRTGHAAVSTSEEDAEVLWMATSADIPQAPATIESTKK
ncbi:XRE family transcriptional regulator [Paraburkholderia sp. BL18I3N2]|nr:XRE family transcriptional regulator [Paraburkholderia sp. BL18I3N2]